jgi:hypothetical protein
VLPLSYTTIIDKSRENLEEILLIVKSLVARTYGESGRPPLS